MLKKKLVNAILLTLEKTVDGYVKFEDFTYNTHFYAFYGSHDVKKSALSQALKRLRKKDFVEKVYVENQLIYNLSHLGKEFLLTNKLDEEVDWDGKWRLVMFDIPEKYKKVRESLRRRLREWEFSPWQKSVWASKKPLTRPLRDLVKQLKVEDWVLVVESDNVGK